jgi:hypothetical protein
MANGMNPIKAKLDEQNKIDSASFLQQFQGQNLIGKDPSFIKKQAIEKFGPNFDMTRIDEGINNIMGGQTTMQNQLNAQENQAFNRENQQSAREDRAEARNSRNLGKNSMAILSSTGDFNAAMKATKGDPAAMMQVIQMNHAASQLTDVQQQEVATAGTVVNNYAQQTTNRIDSDVKAINDSLKVANPFRNGLEEQATSFQGKDVEGIIGAVEKGENWDNNAIKTMRNSLTYGQNRLKGMPAGVAETLILQTLQDIGGASEDWLGFGDKSFGSALNFSNHQAKFTKAYEANVAKYADYYKLKKDNESTLAQLNGAKSKAIATAEAQMGALKLKYTKGNLANTNYSLTEEDLAGMGKTIQSVYSPKN